MIGTRGRWMVVGVMGLATAGCGAGDAAGGGAGDRAAGGASITADAAATAGDEGEAGDGDTTVRTGSEALVPELANLPLPPDASLRAGFSGGGLVSQQVDTDLDLAAAEAFYLEHLPAAGFAVEDDRPRAAEGAGLIAIGFTTADGVEGTVTLQAGDRLATLVNVSMVVPG